MTNNDFILEQAARLKAAGAPFALVTVVRCESPTSAKPGAKAIVNADGTIDGWIGGGCAQPAVIKTVKQALQDGQARLIRISPERSDDTEEGVIDFGMTCHSGGTLDIFVDPVVNRARLLIIGASPAAQTLSGLAPRVGFAVTAAFPGADRELFPDADRIVDGFEGIELAAPGFVVVSTQGKRDEAGLEAALATGAEYITFIASERKADKLKQYLKERGHDHARVDGIVSPAGVEIGAETPEEIALSVLAGVVQARRGGRGAVHAASAGQSMPPVVDDAVAAEAIDPVCGMTVDTATAEHYSQYEGQSYFFCCAHCKHSFDKEPERYLEAAAS
jgi:xanthine dehydrogenase accessory factor